MHELSIALSILDFAAEESDRRGGARIAAIHLKLGPLSGVIKDALLSAYELARETSPLSGCQLLIEQVPLVVYCPACDTERSIESPQRLCCDLCGTPTPDIRSGRQLEIAALEICQ